jgi:chromosomal replication initiation ATPase DnaA
VAIANRDGVTLEALRSPRRQPPLVVARSTAVYLLRLLTAATLADIGAELARSHQTVIRLHENAVRRRQADAEYAAWLDLTAKTIAAANAIPAPVTDLPLFSTREAS